MNHSVVYEGSRTQLINQLVFFDDEKMNFLDQFFPEPNQKRSMVEQTLNVYISNLEKILSDFSADQLHSIALIGSQLELRYLDDHSTEQYTIVFPNQANPSENKVSFLSPLGFQLLMARHGETYQLDVPSGQISVKVEGIKFVNGGNVN